MGYHCQIWQRKIAPKVRKAEMPFLYATRHLILFYMSTKSHRNIPTADRNSFSNKTKGDNSKSKKVRVVILIWDTSSCPDLHFYQVSSKYSKGYSRYRADKKFYANADGIRPKVNIPPPHALVGGQGGGGGHNDQKCKILCINFYIQLASIGQSDAPLTGDQEVKDSIPAESATFSLRLVIKSLQ